MFARLLWKLLWGNPGRLAVALIAVSLPAGRAASVNPTEALRAE